MQTDIAQLLTNIKLNIAAIEQGERHTAILNEIEADCIQLLELMKLFLISERDSYYGYFLMNLTYDVDFSSRSIAGILLNRFPPVFHTNPLLLCKFTLKEILFIVCHEIDHIVLNHPAEMLKSNPERNPDVFERFNLAADASVNDRLLKEMKDEHRGFLSAPEGHISSTALKRMFKLRTVYPLESYLYYFQLIQNKPLPERAQQPQRMLFAAGNAGESEQEPDGDVVTAETCGKPTDHEWNAGEDAEEATAAVFRACTSTNEQGRGARADARLLLATGANAE